MQLIGYLRVSTVKQQASGLGLDAQRDALAAYKGGKLICSYTETESGKLAERPELAKALAHAQRIGATLLVAKLDRLSRNVAFLSSLMESRVPFICCDNPHATPLTLHILSAVAEHEARMISQRTKDALAAARRRGVLLGGRNPNCKPLSEEARRKGAAISGQRKTFQARMAYRDLIPIMLQMRSEAVPFRDIATHLNNLGHCTRRGVPFRCDSIQRILQYA